jgi:hypothetical protein
MALMDTLREIIALHKEVDDQARLVDDFLRANKDTMQFVRAELRGSTKGYDQRMVSALTQTETSLTKSITALRQASDALSRVRTI